MCLQVGRKRRGDPEMFEIAGLPEINRILLRDLHVRDRKIRCR